MVGVLHVRRNHGWRVLVGDSVFGCLHLLLFNKFIMPSGPILDIRVIPVVHLVTLPLVADENDVAVVDGSLIRAAVRPLLIVGLSPADARASWVPIVLVQSAHGVPTDVLRGRLGEVEQWGPSRLGSRCDAASVAKAYRTPLSLTISHERLIVCVQLELLGQFLLGHIQPLVVHIALVGPCSQIGWQVVLDVDGLRHIFHLIADPLATLRVALTTWAIGSDAVSQVLVLGSRTLQWIKVELVLVWGSGYAPLVHLLRHSPLLHHAVKGVVDHLGWAA
jgi:hypothetical protein